MLASSSEDCAAYPSTSDEVCVCGIYDDVSSDGDDVACNASNFCFHG
jgi:hypothetical protein